MSCMCGDALCPSCNPGAAEREAIREFAMEKINSLPMSKTELDLFLYVGTAAIVAHRRAEVLRIEAELANRAEIMAGIRCEMAERIHEINEDNDQ